MVASQHSDLDMKQANHGPPGASHAGDRLQDAGVGVVEAATVRNPRTLSLG